MFDLDNFLTTSPIDVSATNIRFQDSRTGEVYTRTIFRPVKTLSFPVLAKEMAHYGYILLWADDEPGDVPGKMDWSEIFGKFLQQESV